MFAFVILANQTEKATSYVSSGGGQAVTFCEAPRDDLGLTDAL